MNLAGFTTYLVGVCTLAYVDAGFLYVILITVAYIAYQLLLEEER